MKKGLNVLQLVSVCNINTHLSDYTRFLVFSHRKYTKKNEWNYNNKEKPIKILTRTLVGDPKLFDPVCVRMILSSSRYCIFKNNFEYKLIVK